MYIFSPCVSLEQAMQEEDDPFLWLAKEESCNLLQRRAKCSKTWIVDQMDLLHSWQDLSVNGMALS